ncbi:3-isopropylmalate dehydratase small subunit [Marispirochaeta sp.]|uniref:3-isopropylmalate dehydratase small subunit n=1 Tax=Marispirochaeta sp. TaxID=2038653 RepID=UPI0029C7931F|nr:3-isopropylmalate dehydratase small subunit [Marispirochaeta sp.]
MKNFSGQVLFLDRSDINTDEIIPAKYLTEITREALGPHLLEDLVLDGFNPDKDIDGKKVIVTRKNFGCGSSREHAPWALEARGINIVIAPSFARIFRQNMFNCGMLAIEISPQECENLFARFSGKEVSAATDMEVLEFTFSSGSYKVEIPFKLSEFEKDLIQAGGWVEYADAKY